jgi:MFS-type transporter involved in bile tolerance (Atg22 family)
MEPLAKARRRLIPFLFLPGAIHDATHSFAYGLLAIAVLMLTGGALVLLMPEDG